jgi:hypothetical protein
MEPSVGPAGSRPALGWRVEGKIALEDRDEVQHIKSGRTGHGPCIETPPGESGHQSNNGRQRILGRASERVKDLVSREYSISHNNRKTVERWRGYGAGGWPGRADYLGHSLVAAGVGG